MGYVKQQWMGDIKQQRAQRYLRRVGNRHTCTGHSSMFTAQGVGMGARGMHFLCLHRPLSLSVSGPQPTSHACIGPSRSMSGRLQNLSVSRDSSTSGGAQCLPVSVGIGCPGDYQCLGTSACPSPGSSPGSSRSVSGPHPTSHMTRPA